ncbi:unnamed protein product [Rhodiola kirilowii]
MWPPWLSSPSRVEPTPTTTPRRRGFSTCSTFKDVEKLLREEEDQKQQKHLIIHQFRHKKLPSLFHRVRISASVLRALSTDPDPKSQSDRPITLKTNDRDVVVYFTSLRVVRRTFDDCRTVRSILRSFRVPIDERDVSMDCAFLEELQQIFGTKSVSLPRVFISGRYVGGAEEVRQLHECGELKKLIGSGGGGMWHCQVCDGHRFVVCENCDGSHKVYIEKIGFRSCSDCNLNGLIRCPNCFSRQP